MGCDYSGAERPLLGRSNACGCNTYGLSSVFELSPHVRQPADDQRSTVRSTNVPRPLSEGSRMRFRAMARAGQRGEEALPHTVKSRLIWAPCLPNFLPFVRLRPTLRAVPILLVHFHHNQTLCTFTKIKPSCSFHHNKIRRIENSGRRTF